MTLVWAYVAGLLTLINPCVLPLLPVTIAAALKASRLGPLALAAGLISAFVAVGLGVTAFGHLVGLDDHVVNRIAAGLMILFGVVLLVPPGQRLMALAAAPLANAADARLRRDDTGDGLAGQFTIGLLLGAVWSPCVGPTLGGAIGLAASGEDLLRAGATMLVFGAGVASVLLGLAYGSRSAVGARRARLRCLLPHARLVLGGTLLAVGLAVWWGLDKMLEAWLLDAMPVWLQDLSVSV